MKRVGRNPDTYLPLSSAEFHILLTLADGERHGYAIMQAIAKRTPIEKVHLGPATLYRSIKQLLDLDMIEESSERADPAVGDERRRYYKLTDFGRQVFKAEIQMQQYFVDLAQQALERMMEPGHEPSEWEETTFDTVRNHDR